VANGPWVEKTGKDFDVTLLTMEICHFILLSGDYMLVNITSE